MSQWLVGQYLFFWEKGGLGGTIIVPLGDGSWTQWLAGPWIFWNKGRGRGYYNDSMACWAISFFSVNKGGLGGNTVVPLGDGSWTQWLAGPWIFWNKGLVS